MQLDEENVQSIMAMKPPNNISELRRTLGLLTYVSSISIVTERLRMLLKKYTACHWSWEQEQAFSDIKNVLSEV